MIFYGFFFDLKELHFIFQFHVFSLKIMKMSKKRKMCFICKKNTKEQLLCSFNANNQEQAHIYDLYNEAAQKINQFENEHLMPVEMV